MNAAKKTEDGRPIELCPGSEHRDVCCGCNGGGQCTESKWQDTGKTKELRCVRRCCCCCGGDNLLMMTIDDGGDGGVVGGCLGRRWRWLLLSRSRRRAVCTP